MSRSDLYSQLEQTHTNLTGLTVDQLQAILDAIADHRYGFRTGHEPTGHTPIRNHDHDCDCDGCAPPPPYSDRTGELAATGRDTSKADAKAVAKAVHQMWSASMTLADFAQRLADRSPVVRYCASCKRDGGRETLVAAGRYTDACRFCGESRSRNDDQWPPVAILRQYWRSGGSTRGISDQLIRAHPLPNGKLWKREKRRVGA